jgi:hypothetical protein
LAQQQTTIAKEAENTPLLLTVGNQAAINKQRRGNGKAVYRRVYKRLKRE